MEFPVQMQFKVAALTPQITVTDANGQVVCYVKQKMFKLKESINIFADSTQTQQLYQINADKKLDFSARYHFSDSSGNTFGSVKRHGRKSIWKARYDIHEGDQVVATIHEDNAWVKVGDAVFSELPIIGLLGGYVFNPSYTVTQSDGTPIMRIKKQASLTGRIFTIEKLADLPEVNQVRNILSILMMTLRERRRG